MKANFLKEKLKVGDLILSWHPSNSKKHKDFNIFLYLGRKGNMHYIFNNSKITYLDNLALFTFYAGENNLNQIKEKESKLKNSYALYKLKV